MVSNAPTNGNDRLIGTTDADILNGLDGNDGLSGLEGNDTLNGGSGNDTVHGGIGADVLDGGDGYDTLDYRPSDEGVHVNLETNTANGGHATGDTIANFERVLASNFNDHIVGNALNNAFDGREGDDHIEAGGGNDTVHGGDGADVLDGGDGYDTLDYRPSDEGVQVNLETNTASGGHATGDTIANFERVLASNFNDYIVGNALNNAFDGREGDDHIEAGDGNDAVHGGDGADVLDGGDGYDTLDYRGSDAAVMVNLEMNMADGGHATGDVIANFERVYGSDFNDYIIGDAGGNSIISGNGNDCVATGDGDDAIHGGDGADFLDGGDGYDTLDYRGSNAAVMVNLETNMADGGHATGDVIANFERVYGSNFDDYIIGDAGGNAIISGNGNDRIAGGDGNDQLYGGRGCDRLYGGTGYDRLEGGDDNDVLIGNENNDTLMGGSGNDRLIGGQGRDYIDGGDGTDTVSFQGDSGVILDLAQETATVASPDGFTYTDTILNIERVIGSAYDDTLIGDEGHNDLRGKDGNDRLLGGDGNDVLMGGRGIDTIDGGDGYDTVSFIQDDYAVIVDLSQETATFEDVHGTVYVETVRNVERVSGSAYDDILMGNDEDNVLWGAEGYDTLIGGQGQDTLFGGSGADRFVLGSPSDSTAHLSDFDSIDGDRIQLVGQAFGLSLGQLSSQMFTLGSAATDGGDRLIYDTTSGTLYFDHDGSGTAQQTIVAQLNRGTALTYTDITVI